MVAIKTRPIDKLDITNSSIFSHLHLSQANSPTNRFDLNQSKESLMPIIHKRKLSVDSFTNAKIPPPNYIPLSPSVRLNDYNQM